jgi:hypothetical protein
MEIIRSAKNNLEDFKKFEKFEKKWKFLENLRKNEKF